VRVQVRGPPRQACGGASQGRGPFYSSLLPHPFCPSLIHNPHPPITIHAQQPAHPRPRKRVKRRRARKRSGAEGEEGEEGLDEDYGGEEGDEDSTNLAASAFPSLCVGSWKVLMLSYRWPDCRWCPPSLSPTLTFFLPPPSLTPVSLLPNLLFVYMAAPRSWARSATG
jgi:hypothetical protein